MKGQCHCGFIEYSLLSEITEAYCCHCKDCRILSGSGYHFLGIVDKDALNLQSGLLSTYTNRTQSGHEMSRYFCPKCSTPIYIESTRFGDIKMLLVSSLENSGSTKPSFEIWNSSKYCWQQNHSNTRIYQQGAND